MKTSEEVCPLKFDLWNCHAKSLGSKVASWVHKNGPA